MAGIRRVSDLGTRGWSNILDGSIVTADLANSSVTTAKIADNNITQAKLDTSIPINGFKNGIINGSFDVWQRANSATFTPTVNVARYDTADRWAIINGNVVSSITATRVAADNSFLNYGLQWGRQSGQTNTGPIVLAYNMESLNAKKYAGKQITFSFWLKKGSGTSPSSVTFQAFTATGTDQGTTLWWTTGWTGQVKVVDVAISPSTTMTRYQYTFTPSSTTNQMIFVLFYNPSGTASNEILQIEGVQLEEGSYATPFEQRPYGLELQLCQRYYEAVVHTHANRNLTLGYLSFYNVSRLGVRFLVQKRAAPDQLTVTALNVWVAGASGITSPTPNVLQITETGFAAEQSGNLTTCDTVQYRASAEL